MFSTGRRTRRRLPSSTSRSCVPQSDDSTARTRRHRLASRPTSPTVIPAHGSPRRRIRPPRGPCPQIQKIWKKELLLGCSIHVVMLVCLFTTLCRILPAW